MNFIEEDSDSSVDGYDRSSAQWITANKAKRNKAKYPKNGAGTFNKHDEKGQERRAREEDGSSLPESAGADKPAPSDPSEPVELERTSSSRVDTTFCEGDRTICRGGSLKRCGRAVTDEAEGVQCNVCSGWYHALCQTLTPVAVEALKKFKGLAWICHECDDHLKSGMIRVLRPNNNSADEKLAQLVSAVAQQASKIERITKGYEQLCSEIQASQSRLFEGQGKDDQGMKRGSFADIVKGSCDEVVSKITSTIENIPQGIGQETLERERRKCNVVVHNLPESQTESSKARLDEDIRNVMDIIKDELHIYARVVSAFRVGQRQRDRPRLLIVKFETEASKWDVVRYARHLQHSHKWSNIYINPDLTKDERQAGKQLRQELDQRRKNGEKDLVIRNKKIIQVKGSDENYRNRLETRQNDSFGAHGSKQLYDKKTVQQDISNPTNPHGNGVAFNASSSGVAATRSALDCQAGVGESDGSGGTAASC